MASELVRLELRVSLRWWLRLYLYGVATMVQLTGLDPDMEKVGRKIEAGVRITQAPRRERKPCERCQRIREAARRFVGLRPKAER